MVDVSPGTARVFEVGSEKNKPQIQRQIARAHAHPILAAGTGGRSLDERSLINIWQINRLSIPLTPFLSCPLIVRRSIRPARRNEKKVLTLSKKRRLIS